MARASMLLVEDDAALAELLIYHFKREDFDVAHTPDGEEALLLAKEKAPDIVLLDWMVEGLSGIEVCRRLRRMTETQNVPIIMLTARGEEEDRIRGLETGADDYVTKPFSPRELVARVSAVLRRVRPALAGEALTYDDIEMDMSATRSAARARSCRWGRPNSGCSSISSNIPAGCSAASGCSTRSGATTATSRAAPSTSIFAGCARRSTSATART
jgi:DNA-binding response OmpR family regulator